MFCVFLNLTEKLSLLFIPLKLNKLSLWRRIQGCSLSVNIVLWVHRFWQIYGHLYCWLTRFHTMYKHLFSLLALISSYSAYYSDCSKFPTVCLAFICRKTRYLWFNNLFLNYEFRSIVWWEKHITNSDQSHSTSECNF